MAFAFVISVFLGQSHESESVGLIKGNRIPICINCNESTSGLVAADHGMLDIVDDESQESNDYKINGITDVCCNWGSNIGSGMTTLSNSEWMYLKKALFSSLVSVAGVSGRVLKPDGFTGTVNTYYTAETWKAAEEIGLVFFPFAGYLKELKCLSIGTRGYCQPNTPFSYSQSYRVEIETDSYDVTPRTRVDACSVRLVSVQE